MKGILAAIAGVWLFTACSPEAYVQTDYDREADFSKYTTFTFSAETDKEREGNPLFNNSLVRKRIKNAIKDEMQGRGYDYVEAGTAADLQVNFHLVTEEKTTYRNLPYYGAYYWWGNNYQPVEYTEGMLIIDLVDAETNQLVWQGYTSRDVDRQPEDNEQQMREAVSLIFQEYPYRAGSGQRLEARAE